MATPWLYRPPVTTYASAETWVPQSNGAAVTPSESELPPSASPCIIQQLRRIQLEANLQNAQGLSPKRPRPPDLNRGESASLSNWGAVSDAWLQQQATEAARRLAVQHPLHEPAGLPEPVVAERPPYHSMAQHNGLIQLPDFAGEVQDPASPFGFPVSRIGCDWDLRSQQEQYWDHQQFLMYSGQGHDSQPLYVPFVTQAGTMLSPFSAVAAMDPPTTDIAPSTGLPPAINTSLARRSTGGGHSMAANGQQPQQQAEVEGGRPLNKV
jgi:hypothetical protein